MHRAKFRGRGSELPCLWSSWSSRHLDVITTLEASSHRHNRLLTKSPYPLPFSKSFKPLFTWLVALATSLLPLWALAYSQLGYSWKGLMNSKRCSSLPNHSENHEGFGSSVPGTRTKNKYYNKICSCSPRHSGSYKGFRSSVPGTGDWQLILNGSTTGILSIRVHHWIRESLN